MWFKNEKGRLLPELLEWVIEKDIKGIKDVEKSIGYVEKEIL